MLDVIPTSTPVLFDPRWKGWYKGGTFWGVDSHIDPRGVVRYGYRKGRDTSRPHSGMHGATPVSAAIDGPAWSAVGVDSHIDPQGVVRHGYVKGRDTSRPHSGMHAATPVSAAMDGPAWSAVGVDSHIDPQAGWM